MEELTSIIHVLEEFKSDQLEYWREIKQISDDADDDPLPVILENNEEYSQEGQMLLDQIHAQINYLREGEIKIIERYKHELKTIALELKQYECDKVHKGTQTEIIFEDLYNLEKQKLQAIERKIDALKKFDDQKYKQEISAELTALKSKIEILTQTSADAEAILLRKDSQLKDCKQQISYIQKELTQKRGELSIMKDQILQKDGQIKLLTTLNKNYETDLANKGTQKEVLKDRNIPMPKKSQPQPQPQPSQCYKQLALEIQEITLENTQLKQQIQVLNKKVKSLENQVQSSEEKIHQLSNQNESQTELVEAMEYLEIKDREIQRLYSELESVRRGGSQNNHVKDLQNLLLLMSRNLQEKEQLIMQLQNQ